MFVINYNNNNNNDNSIVHLSQLVPVRPGKQKQAYLPPGKLSHVDPKLHGSEEQAILS